MLGGVRARAATGRGARRRRDRRHPRGQRPAEGRGPASRPRAARAWPTTPASRSTPSTARPACTRPASPGEDATYADNVAKLLAELQGVRRPAGPVPHGGAGRVPRRPRGRRRRQSSTAIIAAAAAATGGFGYDPVFVPDGERRPHLRRDVDCEEKNAISHRGRAFRALAADLPRSPAARGRPPTRRCTASTRRSTPHALVVGDGRVDVGGRSPGRGRRRARPSGARR